MRKVFCVGDLFIRKSDPMSQLLLCGHGFFTEINKYNEQTIKKLKDMSMIKDSRRMKTNGVYSGKRDGYLVQFHESM